MVLVVVCTFLEELRQMYRVPPELINFTWALFRHSSEVKPQEDVGLSRPNLPRESRNLSPACAVPYHSLAKASLI